MPKVQENNAETDTPDFNTAFRCKNDSAPIVNSCGGRRILRFDVDIICILQKEV